MRRNSLLASLFMLSAFCLAQSNAAPQRDSHIGLPQDWSFRHVLHPGPITQAENGRFHDPRAIYAQLQRNRILQAAQTKAGNTKTTTQTNKLQKDWSFTLGSAGMADGMSPAKYSFDVNATPNCSSDFVLYTVNTAGSSSQPNIVGFNNIYAGSSTALTIAASPNGAAEVGNTVTITTTTSHGLVVGQQVTIAGVGVAGYNGTYTVTTITSTTKFTYTNPTSGLGTGGGGTATPLGLCGQYPSMKWAYNASTNGGTMSTSPVLSLSGAKVAFVESSASGSVFHVLLLDSGTAGNFSCSGTCAYSTATPTTAANGSTTPGTMFSVSLGSAAVTLASPWVDYGTDSAYVGDDNGTLYHITNVFNIGGTPTLDYQCTVASGKILSGPVWDQTSQAVFVGASDGKLYRLTGGSACTSASITVGDGTTTNAGGTLIGGINDSPLLDNVFQVLYASSANSGGGQLVEVGTGVGSAKPFTNAGKLATISNGSSFYVVHSPALTDDYFSNVSGTTVTPTGHMIGCAANNSKAAFLYSSPFSNANSGTNTPLSPSNPPIVGASSSSNPPGNASAGCSPVAEFNNGSDRIFFSQPVSVSNKCGSGSSGYTGGCLFSNALSAGTPTTTYNAFMSNGGTSGVIVDNVSNVNGTGQTSSIYFGDLGSNTCSNAGTSSAGFCAVKLTQSGLQ